MNKKTFLDNPVQVTSDDVINVLLKYKNKLISKSELVDWVNIIWFSDCYDYNEKHNDSIASVMDKLEELDETDQELTSDEIDLYIASLKANKEID